MPLNEMGKSVKGGLRKKIRGSVWIFVQAQISHLAVTTDSSHLLPAIS